ncbi:cuc-1 [Pristionchus pacificus]|uniref:Copper transport protein ATOX1 n=1 Tax=Pristionchus pacificus TaxID=54126 RepID=A0A2A6BAW0_PRIPA|nr:cuc-1 [Pristionchus pacificus]|eukprot:PDM63029.1 cuc-1 [Pristionchus pacificus]
MPQTHTFEMGMTCGSCANAARRVLEKMGEGITIDSIDVPTKRIVVTTEKSAEEVKTQLEKTGKAVSGVRITHIESH